MKTKRLLFVISIVSFMIISLVSCGDDGYMDKGETSGGGAPPPPNMMNYDNTRPTDSIKANAYLPND